MIIKDMASDYTIDEDISAVEMGLTTLGSVHFTLPSFDLDRIMVNIFL